MKKLLIIAMLFVACASQEEDTKQTLAKTAAVVASCRNYPTSITDTTNSITYTCSLSGSTLSCTNGGTETITYVYPSLTSFIEEAVSGLTVFNKITATSLNAVSATPARNYNISYTYNGSSQLSATTIVNNGVTISVTYSTWDSSNRPLTGTAQFTAGATCTGRSISYTYVDGTNRTKSVNNSGGTGANCSSLNLTGSQVDADGNPKYALTSSFTTNSITEKCN